MAYSGVKYKKFNSFRRFGVELEVSNTFTKAKVSSLIREASSRLVLSTRYQLSTENPYWHVKDDATCGPQGRLGPKGVEIASFVGQGMWDLQHIADVAEFVQKAGCQVNDNCGLHIHAEAVDLNDRQIGTILSYWMKLEETIAQSLPASRVNNDYCRFVMDRCPDKLDRSRAISPEALWMVMAPVDLNYYENESRRVTLNLVNYARASLFKSDIRKTIELRWPEGTLNPRDIKCWVRLFLNFLETVKNYPPPKNLLPCDTLDEALGYLGLNHDAKDFVIFSDGLHDTKTWFLERLTKYSSGDAAKQAKNTLNGMWSPVKIYA